MNFDRLRSSWRMYTLMNKLDPISHQEILGIIQPRVVTGFTKSFGHLMVIGFVITQFVCCQGS